MVGNRFSQKLTAFAQEIEQLRAQPNATTLSQTLDSLHDAGRDLLREYHVLERRSAEQMAQLQQERNFVAAILDTAEALVAVTDCDGRIVHFNRACERVSGYGAEEVRGHTFWELPLLPDEEKERLRNVFMALCAGNYPSVNENHWVTRTGARRLLSWSNTVMVTPEGEVQYIVGVGIDVTEQREAEAALRRSEAFNQAVLSSLTAHIAVIDRRGEIVAVNDAWRRFGETNGAEPETIAGVGLNYLQICRLAAERGLENAARAAQGIAHVLTGEAASYTLEYDCHAPREKRWFLMTVSPLVYNGDGAVIAHINITERKRAEEERLKLIGALNRQRQQLSQQAVRLRRLAHEVVTAQEEERARVSSELHDEAGQALTVLKYSLALVLADMEDRESRTLRAPEEIDLAQIVQRLRESIQLCETTMTQIRLLAHDLRPTTLDNVGLDLTLEGYCRDVAERTNLAIAYTGAEVAPLPSPVEITLYRFLQEALTNVIRHAETEHVWVRLRDEDTAVSLTVEDDGRGFDVQAVLSGSTRTRNIGLVAMRERIESLGGALEIDSVPDRGTRLTARLPR